MIKLGDIVVVKDNKDHRYIIKTLQKTTFENTAGISVHYEGKILNPRTLAEEEWMFSFREKNVEENISAWERGEEEEKY